MKVSTSMKSVATVLLALLAVVQGFAARNSRPAGRRVNREDLPTLEIPRGAPTSEPPNGVSSKDFYLPTYTLLRSGPVSFVRRITVGKKYDQYVWKYMKDYKEDSLMTAQGNADAFLASADDWAEQKYLESQNRREIYDYGKPLPTERVVLSSVWATGIILLLSRVAWQLANGNRNLF